MGSLSPAHADNDDDASPADDGPSAVDAATSFDQVPREEAERFALLEDSYWKFVTAAEDVEGFAGAWVSWEPLTVHFATTAEPPAELLAIFDEPSLITHHDVEYDLVQLEAAQQELIELRAEGSIPPVDLDIDIRENELVVYSPDTATFSRVQALADVELPIRWEQAPLAAPTTSGGGSGTLCNNGDSGGPWFQFSNAVGLTSGKVASGSNAGNCIVASITYQIPSGWILTT